MNSDITIRSYRDGDLEACRELWVQLTEQHRDIYDAPEIGGEDPGARFDKQLALAGPGQLWVAEEEGRVVGLAGLQPGNAGGLEIEPVVVAGTHRGRGIGRRLVATTLENAAAAGHKVLSVKVVGRNREAIGFYHALGFDVVGMIELMHDSRPNADQRWQPGDQVAGLQFRK